MDFAVNENQKQYFDQNTENVPSEKIPAEKVEPKPAVGRVECTICCKSFSKLANYNMHFRSFHERYIRFKCNFCDYKTGNQTNFQTHLTTHLDMTPNTTKRNKIQFPEPINELDVCLSCPICSENFDSIENLKQHLIKNHQVLRKFECDYCGWRTVNKHDVSDHITCKHSLISRDNGIYDQDRPFKCTFKGCQKRFKIEKYQKKHTTRHLGEVLSTRWN